MDLKHYRLLADLFDYPDPSFFTKIPSLVSFLKGPYPSAAAEVRIFRDQLLRSDLDHLQEVYTRSFDVQAITTLDAGYVLFGDHYKRGELLSRLTREHKTAHHDCGTELADHLPNLLRLLSKSEDADFVQDLVREILAPALGKMIDEFGPERMAKKDKLYRKHYKTLLETSPDHAAVYRHALNALFSVLRQDFQIHEETPDKFTRNDFLGSLNAEMSVEEVADP